MDVSVKIKTWMPTGLAFFSPSFYYRNLSVTGFLGAGFLCVPISGANSVSADVVSSESSPGVDCCVFHRKADE